MLFIPTVFIDPIDGEFAPFFDSAVTQTWRVEMSSARSGEKGVVWVVVKQKGPRPGTDA